MLHDKNSSSYTCTCANTLILASYKLLVKVIIIIDFIATCNIQVYIKDEEKLQFSVAKGHQQVLLETCVIN